MINWLSSMEQTFEYYIVDPITWKDVRQLDKITSCSITYDATAETLGSATIETTEQINESYIRIYLISIQNGERDKRPLGTFLAQSPSNSFDGKIKSYSMDAYTPLLELKEKKPPIGYTILKENSDSDDKTIMEWAYKLTDENTRAIVVKADNDKKLTTHYTAGADDTWLKFLSDLITNAKYKFALDENGRILFKPDQKIETLQPKWTFTDDNSSILYPDIDVSRDIFGVPNVVEIIYSNATAQYHKRIVNDDPNSPTSTVNRGREIIHRITDPGFTGIPTEEQIDEYARTMLKELSTIEYSITYSHGYCPVNVGDCVMINYKRSDLNNVKAKIVRQSIKCEPGCPVTEKAIFTEYLWRPL